jgi:hypothetical protein
LRRVILGFRLQLNPESCGDGEVFKMNLLVRLLWSAVFAILFTIVAASSAQDHSSRSAILSACAVTIPSQSKLLHGNYGNGKLWTTVWSDGKVAFRPGGPGFVLPDGSVAMKFPWWRGVEGKLTIQGRRLDAAAAPLRAEVPEGYGDTGFQASEIIFPTTGCWGGDCQGRRCESYVCD